MEKPGNNPSDIELQEMLIDQLLREEVGSDIPPDMTDRIMMQVRGRQANARADRKRGNGIGAGWRTWWMPAALAAMILVAVGIWFTHSNTSYPAVQAKGNFTVAGGGEIRPGAVVITAPAQEAQIVLGGYAQVNIGPETRLKVVEGGQFKESVFLELGQATTQVEKKRGEFAVVTEHLKAMVTGTKFCVRVAMDPDPRTGQSIKRTTVNVIEGSVDVVLPTGTVPLRAGGTMTYPAIPGAESAVPKPSTPAAPVEPAVVRAFEPISKEGEVHVIGILSEGKEGWSITERSGRRTLVLPRAEYPKGVVQFQGGGEYVVILKDGKLARAVAVEPSRR